MALPRTALLLTTCWLVFSCACNRTEEPASPATEAGSPATTIGGNPPASGGAATAPAPPSGGGANMTMPVCTVPLAAPAPVASKAATCPKDPTGNLTLPMGRVTFVDAAGAPAVDVELARDDASRERGLMYRTSMAENAGMLFSWSDERVRSFWMRNTCIPLDLLYITKDGIISGILEQVPTLNEAPRRINCPVAHVLELNAGWTRAHGITPGTKVTIEG
jgi:uncharacterized membrane protein (UPF0127 family)